jgi:hypothetical protein
MAVITLSGIRFLDEGDYRVVLPNGRKIELSNRQGADEFVDTVGTDFATDDEELTYVYITIQAINGHASPEKIASGIPESELRTFIEYTRDTLGTLSTDRNWLRSGTLNEHHEILLEAVAGFSEHPSFLKIYLSNEGNMEVVAKFYASRKMNDTPNHSVARSIVILLRNALDSFAEEGLPVEKAFAILEKTGLLGQFIRCIPLFPER